MFSSFFRENNNFAMHSLRILKEFGLNNAMMIRKFCNEILY